LDIIDFGIEIQRLLVNSKIGNDRTVSPKATLRELPNLSILGHRWIFVPFHISTMFLDDGGGLFLQGVFALIWGQRGERF
jgi:hypothetical protein